MCVKRAEGQDTKQNISAKRKPSSQIVKVFQIKTATASSRKCIALETLQHQHAKSNKTCAVAFNSKKTIYTIYILKRSNNGNISARLRCSKMKCKMSQPSAPPPQSEKPLSLRQHRCTNRPDVARAEEKKRRI